MSESLESAAAEVRAHLEIQAESLAEIRDGSKAMCDKVAGALRDPAFQEPKPRGNEAEVSWLCKRVTLSDSLDPGSPMMVAHWSTMKIPGQLAQNPSQLSRCTDVIDTFTKSKSSKRLAIAFVSREQQGHDELSEANQLCEYSLAAEQQGIDLYFYIDVETAKQEQVREKISRACKLPLVLACCTDFLLLWSDAYQSCSWTRLQHLLGYVFSPASVFSIISKDYPKKVLMKDIVGPAVFRAHATSGTLFLRITDPCSGELVAVEDMAIFDAVVKLSQQFTPLAVRGTSSKPVCLGTSRIELVRRGQSLSKNAAGEEQGMASSDDEANDGHPDNIAEKMYGGEFKSELLNGFGFTFKWFLIYTFFRSCMPIIFNGLWVAGANLGSCGGTLQNFWVFLFEYEFYFMLLKSLMITMYFRLFMPVPSPARGTYTPLLHMIVVVLLTTYNASMGLLWWALGLHTKEHLSYFLFKLNFPTAAILTFVTWMLPYICLNYKKADRFLAAKRYLLLVVVLVCDIAFIATSHAYVWVFNYTSEHVLPDLSDFTSQVIQIALVCGFIWIYMPLLGKIWWVGIFLLDKFAPMDDLQHQRFVYFATVICDVHRLMYSRELFVHLDSYIVFYGLLCKDFAWLFYQVVIKSLVTWQTFIFGVFHTDGQGWRIQDDCLRKFRNTMEYPRRWLAWNHHVIDAGYRDEEGNMTGRQVSMFCCDMVIIIRNVPRPFSDSFAKLKMLSKEEHGEQIKTSTLDSAFHLVEATTDSGKEHMHVRGHDNDWDILAANYCDKDLELQSRHSAKSLNTTITATTNRLSERRKAVLVVPFTWQAEFYTHINLRVNSIIFMRAQARLTISLSTALSYLLMQLIIRATPSRKILNEIHDHDREVYTASIVGGVSFLVFDLLMMLLVSFVFLRNPKSRTYNLARYGRLFQDNNFFLMIVLCTVCCDSDFYLTYPVMDFCS
ncbi:unnamed protein product [Polarella glacialis]|uniref:Uncharacterized protein n=1 Tax=Polarella glacialis TaxID=89957 RepID=A0A813EXM3_POLGL|nr:unnamed protein product [Polarella glacialis]CAE8696896.1 unnamed protein product [Polarella glacialis]